MSAENDGSGIWYAFGESVTGASHVRKQLPNQDAILWKPDNGLPLALAIADGHGSEKYFRSDIGASFAVAVAVEELEIFARAFCGPVTNVPLFTHVAEQLPKNIVQKWRGKVNDHLAESPFFTKEEWQHYGSGTALPEITRDPLVPYGATLLAVLVTEGFILYMQLGDGDIILVTEDVQVSKPMGRDERLLANETTSLCSPTAMQDFRVHCDHLLGQLPALILLSTDGYANSFTSEKGFLRVGTDILEQLLMNGLDVVQNSLNEWLTAATQQGSGDDVTLGILYHKTAAPIQALKQDNPLPQGEEEEQLLADRDQKEALVPTAGSQDEPEQAISVPSVTTEAALPSPTPHVLSVSQELGEGMYATINAALVSAHAKTRIEVYPGLYRESLLIDKDIELVGMGAYGSVILESPTPCLTIQAPHARVQNLKIQGKDSWLRVVQRPHAVVEIAAGRSLLSHCEIVGGKIGVRICGTTTSPAIQACDIHDQTRIGVVFAEGTLGLLADSRIYATRHMNIAIVGASNPIIRRSHIQQSKGCGICVDKGGAGRIEGCYIVDNQSTGIEIRQQGNPTILGCLIARNQGIGILFAKQGGGKLVECEIAENTLSGIEIKGFCYPQIQHCRLQGGDGPGIAIDGQGKGGGGFIEDCEIAGHAAEGILVQNASNPRIRLCNIHDGKGIGMLVRQRGQVTIEQCKVVRNSSHGVEVSGKGSRLIMSEVEIQQQDSPEMRAVRFIDSSYGQMERCKIAADSSIIGVEISGHVSLYLRLCLIQSGSYALQVQQASEARVEDGSYSSLTYGNESAATSWDKSSHIVYIDEELSRW